MIDKLNLLAPVKKIERSNNILARVAFLNFTEELKMPFFVKKINGFFLLIKFLKNKR